ncbi:MAG: hypothetical protein QOF74_2262 [Caballeronia mineralivorans]|jgi:hypothetical protein|nr:hypothetical protein [Caballeronia mineralivorans]
MNAIAIIAIGVALLLFKLAVPALKFSKSP